MKWLWPVIWIAGAAAIGLVAALALQAILKL